MTRFLKIFAVLLGTTALAAAYTNILENGTNLVVNTDWEVGGQQIVVGGSTSNNMLDIQNGALVSNVTSVVIGRDATSGENAALVDGSGWFVDGALYVGDAGSGNSLSITNSGYVENADAWVGAQASSSNNSVAVGGNAQWNNEGGLIVTNGAGNSISVGSGGAILADSLLISSNNTFNLNDEGTLYLRSSFDASSDGFNWNEGGQFAMTNGTLSGLAETNGSTVLGGRRTVFLDNADLSINGSSLLVGDAEYGGVDFVNGSKVFVGEATDADAGAGVESAIIVASTNGAELVVDSGSYVSTDGTMYLGGTNAALTGTATVSNGSTIVVDNLVINNDGSEFNLEDGGKLRVTGDYNADAQADNVNWNSGSELEVNGTLTLDGGLKGDDLALTLGGSNGNWTINGPIASGTNGTVTIYGGAGVTNLAAGSVEGMSNAVLVTDTDSHWLNNGGLTVNSNGHTVVVQDGGRITAESVDVADGSTLNIKSGGTLAIANGVFDWSATENVSWGSGGTLAIEDGVLEGMTTTNLIYNNSTNDASYIGGGRDLLLNNSSWSDNAQNDLIVGYETYGSSLIITNGSAVTNANGYIGWGKDAGNNSVLVTGADSTWVNTDGQLYLGAYWSGTNQVGTAGQKNYLTVEDGGQVIVGEATTGVDGVLVASTNHAELLIWNGSVDIENTLTLGMGTNMSGIATIKNGSYLSVGDLEINGTNSFLDLQEGGTFDIRSDINLAHWATNGFVWDASNSTLSVGGELTGKSSDLSMGQNLKLDGSNAVWNITGEDLEIGLDGKSVLSLLNGASMTNGNTIIGASTNTGSHGLVMENESYWKSSGDLMVGPNTDDNYLRIYSGSTNELAGSAYIGGENTSGNVADIKGSNTFWSVGGDLQIGSVSNSSGNALWVYSQATVSVESNLVLHSRNTMEMASDGLLSVGGDFALSNNTAFYGAGHVSLTNSGTTLYLAEGNVNISSDIIFEGQGDNTVDVDSSFFTVYGSNSNQYRGFQTLDMNDAILWGYGTNDAFSVVNMTNSYIRTTTGIREGFGELVINGSFASENTIYFAQIDKGRQDLLHFAGTGDIDLAGLKLDVWVPNANTNEYTVLSTEGTLVNNLGSTNIQTGLLLYDADLAQEGDRLNVVLTPSTDEFSSALDYAGTEAVRAGFSGMKNAVFTRTKQLRRNLVSTAHSMPHEAFLMSNTNAPAGAQGPGSDNTIFDMHVWLQFFNGQGVFNAQGESYGYTLNNNGTTIGADRLIGENLNVGFNYTYARGSAQTTNTDSLDNETYWIGLYGEWVSKNGLYVDALAAYGRSNYDSTRVEENAKLSYRGTASYRGDSVGSYVDVGQYYYFKKLSLSPYAGIHTLYTVTDEHEETNENGDSTITVHEMDRNIVESALGLKARHRFDTRIGRFQTTGFAEWTHDFIQDDVMTTLQGEDLGGYSATPVDMHAIKPDADMLNVGLGLSWRNTEYMEIGVGYNGRFSEEYEEHSGSLMLDIMF